MTFNLNCCNDGDGSHFCIFRIQATIPTSCYFVRTNNGSAFLDLVVPFRWLESDVSGMLQCLLTPPQGGYISFDCIHGFFQMFICQCDSCVVIKAIFFFVDLCIGCDVSWGGTFYLFKVIRSNKELLWGTLNILWS